MRYSLEIKPVTAQITHDNKASERADNHTGKEY